MVATCVVATRDLIDLQTDLQDSENTLSTANTLTPTAACREEPTHRVVGPITAAQPEPHAVRSPAATTSPTRRVVEASATAQPEPHAVRSPAATTEPQSLLDAANLREEAAASSPPSLIDAISALPPLPAPAAPARRLLKFARLTGDPVNRGPC